MFDRLFVPADARDALGDSAWLAAMLEVEAALARAEVAAGVIPDEAGEAIGAACRPESFDPAAIADEGRSPGNPVEPLVRALREAVGEDAAEYVHFGATSQDILDTAAMLVSSRVLGLILERLEVVAEECARLADAHRATPMVGRTLLQQAEAVTFGLKAAGWLVAVLEARTALVRVRDERLAVQLGGAAGTVAPLGESGPEVLRLFAGELELAEPVAPWHTNRTRIAELGSALAITAGVAAKIGLDIGLMSQNEVGEVSEANAGASSAMPHKRNPVGSVLAVACARQAGAQASVLTGALVQEHERAFGAWHAEWPALVGALGYTSGAVDASAPSARRPRGPRGADAGEPGAERPRAGSRLGRGLRRAGAGELPGGRAHMRLHYRLDGNAHAPVLALPSSLGTSTELWTENVPYWTERFRILRFDQRGHGGSEVPPGPYSLDDLGRDFVGLLDELGIERVSICGLSLGGATAMWVAAQAPERIDRLVLGCTSARFGDPAQWLERAETVRRAGVEPIADSVVARWFTDDAEPENVARFRSAPRLDPRRGLRRQL